MTGKDSKVIYVTTVTSAAIVLSGQSSLEHDTDATL